MNRDRPVKINFDRRMGGILVKGQAAVEYLLLMAVVVTVMITVMTKVRNWMLADSGTCKDKKFSLICVVKKVFSEEATGNFQYFSLIK